MQTELNKHLVYGAALDLSLHHVRKKGATLLCKYYPIFTILSPTRSAVNVWQSSN